MKHLSFLLLLLGSALAVAAASEDAVMWVPAEHIDGAGGRSTDVVVSARSEAEAAAVEFAVQFMVVDGLQANGVGVAVSPWHVSRNASVCGDAVLCVTLETVAQQWLQGATTAHAPFEASTLAAISKHSEGYALWLSSAHQVHIHATSHAAVTLALGRLLRAATAATSHDNRRHVLLPAALRLAHTPPAWFHTRGHQFTDWGFAFQPWPSAAAAYVRDLVAFGTNQIEIAHINFEYSDELPKLTYYSKLLQGLGLNMSAWYPLNLYLGEQGEEQTTAMFKTLPHFTSLFVPGGDGGVTLKPAAMIAKVANLTKLLRQFHPAASVWVSAQEYSAANLTDFMAAIAQPDVRQWLTGVVYGPHVHVPLTQFLDMVPDGMPVRQYPDLCHTEQTQFPVPRFDPAWVLTYRRQAINPSPRRYHDIGAIRSNQTYIGHNQAGSKGGHLIGFGAYSEGTNDDLNKVVLSLYGSEGSTARDAVQQYADYFFDAGTPAALMAQALFALEEVWSLPIATAQATVASTLATLLQAEAATASPDSNWRLQMYLVRGYYDAIVASRHAWGVETQQMLLTTLASGLAPGGPGPAAALATALGVAKQRAAGLAGDRSLAELYTALASHVATLNATVGAFVVCDQQPDLSLGTLNSSTTDAAFLTAQASSIAALPTPAAQTSALAALLDTREAPAGGYMDVLGSVDAAAHPHLLPGEGAAADPSFYFTPLQGTDGSPPSDAPLALRSFTLTHFDAALTLRYSDLPTAGLKGYNVSFSLWRPAPSSRHSPTLFQLVANGQVMRHYDEAPWPLAPVTVFVPSSLIEAAQYELQVSCNQPPGLAGSGRACFVSVVTVTPVVE